MAEAIERKEETVLDPRGQLELRLEQLRSLTSERDRIELVGANRISRINEATKARVTPLNARINALITEIDVLSQTHRAQLTEVKQSVELRFGTLAWRDDKTGSLVVDDEEAVIAMLESLPGGSDVVKTTKVVLKDALKRNEELLERVPATLARIIHQGSFAISVKPTPFQERSKKKPFTWSRKTS
jgi:phage host-nuclease inhibitor protein Gam